MFLFGWLFKKSEATKTAYEVLREHNFELTATLESLDTDEGIVGQKAIAKINKMTMKVYKKSIKKDFAKYEYKTGFYSAEISDQQENEPAEPPQSPQVEQTTSSAKIEHRPTATQFLDNS